MTESSSSAWRLTCTPTAGFILNPGRNAAEPGPLASEERTVLRELARRVRSDSSQPVARTVKYLSRLAGARGNPLRRAHCRRIGLSPA
jgi:hypothetical protein